MPPARLTDSGAIANIGGRGVEQRQLVGLITRRSGVRIPSPQPSRILPNPGSRPPRVLTFSRDRTRLLPAEGSCRGNGECHGPGGQDGQRPRGVAGCRPERDAERLGQRRARQQRGDAASGPGSWSSGWTMPPRSSVARNRPLARARVASARRVPARSSPRPANAAVPSRRRRQPAARGSPVLPATSRGIQRRSRAAARPAPPRTRGPRRASPRSAGHG